MPSRHGATVEAQVKNVHAVNSEIAPATDAPMSALVKRSKIFS